MRVFPPLLLWVAAASAAAQSALPIYSCVDANGKRYTSDRPIAECLAREQQVHSRDGSVRKVLPPSMTADERVAHEARERVEAERRAALQEAVRRDRNLAQRYPDEATHRRARTAALDPVQRSLKLSGARLELLAKERKPLEAEAEFYVNRKLPGKLIQQFDANDAAVDAQRALIATQEQELARISGLFDIELDRLRKLWNGAPPGSLGPLPAPSSASAQPAAKAASR